MFNLQINIVIALIKMRLVEVIRELLHIRPLISYKNKGNVTFENCIFKLALSFRKKKTYIIL
jgi:hypothetical protein